jgi:hypothetical protein
MTRIDGGQKAERRSTADENRSEMLQGEKRSIERTLLPLRSRLGSLLLGLVGLLGDDGRRLGLRRRKATIGRPRSDREWTYACGRMRFETTSGGG